MELPNCTHIKHRRDGGILLLRIDRPDKKNALTRDMYGALAAHITHATADSAIKVILLTGSEDCFTSGNDVNDFLSQSGDGAERPSFNFMQALVDCNKPVVAAVTGIAIGIGTTMLLHCDLVYASQESDLQLPFSRLGLCPEFASSFLLPKLIGYQRAAEMLMLGNRITSTQAMNFGIVNNVLPAQEVLSHALSKAKELENLPSRALQVTKQLLKNDDRKKIRSTITAEMLEFGKLLESPEAQSIFSAFLNRK